MNYFPQTAPKEFSRAPKSVKTSLLPILLCFSLIGCSETPPADQPTAVPAPATTEPVASVASKPDQQLKEVIDPIVTSAEYSRARWGIAVVSLPDGKLIYEHNGDDLFTPASNMKVYTTAVALDLLGSDYKWRTSVYSDTDPDGNGTVHGNLVLYGRGAPDLLSQSNKESINSLEELARQIAARGIKRIQGDVIGDESYFRGDNTGDGWQWNDLQWYFGAEASALTVNANTVELSITPASTTADQPKVVANDPDGYVQISNNLVSVDHADQIKLGVKRELSTNGVTVWGQYPTRVSGYGVSLSVSRPSLWAATIFARLLKSQGIVVDGIPKFRDSRVAEKDRFNTEGKKELANVVSQPLEQIVKATNKFSVNLYAELLLRTMGREKSAMLNEPSPSGRELGDDEKGTYLIRLWLTRHGVRVDGLAFHDGSGLSRLDLVKPSTTAQLLAAIRTSQAARPFRLSLPVAGTDGTLQSRLKETEGRIEAKTGTLTYDNSLSGYLAGSDGKSYAFSLICNDFTGPGSSIPLIDKLVGALDRHFNPSAPRQKTASAPARP